MNRMYNAMTSDEVHRGTGMKVGNFGSGGRTYVKYKRGGTAANNLMGKRVIVGILLALVAGWFYVKETAYAQTVQCAGHVGKDASPVYPPFDIEPRHNGQLVYAATQQAAVNSPAPSDGFFGVNFPQNVASARRVTEYCQWEEVEHMKRTKVGREPNCRANDDSCNIYKEEKTYTYYKAWRSHRINSFRFDNPTAYHNPDRNPCPAETFHAENGIRLDGARGQRQGGEDTKMLQVGAADAGEALSSWTRVPLSKTTAQATQVALQNGFNEADSRYIYSRGDKDGWTSPIIKAGLAYMADGVIDLGNMGTCNAGDIRVSFEIKTIPDKGMGLAGRQLPTGKIVPFQCRGKAKGEMVVGYPDGSLSLHQFVSKVIDDAKYWTTIHRVGQLIVAAILLLILSAGEDKVTGKKDTATGLFAVGAFWAFVWLWEHQPDAWIILPLAFMGLAGMEYIKAGNMSAGGSGSSAGGGSTAAGEAKEFPPPPSYEEATAYPSKKDTKKVD